MKTITVKDINEARRRALAVGGELLIDGQPFNTARNRAAAKPAGPQRPAPAPQTFTRAEVDALLAEQLAEVEARWQRRVAEAVESAAQAAAQSHRTAAPPAAPARDTTPRQWRFDVKYNTRGAISSIEAHAA